MIIKAAMEVGTLFKLKERDDIYRVVINTSGFCTDCCAYGKERLCKKMPYCNNNPAVHFQKLSSYEVRKAKKEKQLIEYFER